VKFAFDQSDALYGPILTMVRNQLPDARSQPSLRVHQNDEMFRASIFGSPTPIRGKMAYFRIGLTILDALRQTADWNDHPLEKLDRVLDFAAGYGRSTRFLAALLPTNRIWASEILPEAVSFQQTEYGVNALQSSREPADFQCDVSFDLIFVSSLFSHLPERTWGAWLERLHSLLAPSGVLVFSALDETLVTPPHQVPANGLLFLPVNEADSWDVEDYGTAFVSEAFVSRTIKERLACDTYVRLPRSLNFHQDLYIVRESGHLSEPRRFWRGPNGGVHDLNPVDIRKGTFQATGWAVDMDGGPSPDVVVKVGMTQCSEVRPTIDRPDVTNIFYPGDEGLVPSEWATSFRLRAKILRPTPALTVTAKSVNSGKELVLDLLPLQGIYQGQMS
jgi:SAM-dependent methyltransferase